MGFVRHLQKVKWPAIFRWTNGDISSAVGRQEDVEAKEIRCNFIRLTFDENNVPLKFPYQLELIQQIGEIRG
jgi:hypothetical protein